MKEKEQLKFKDVELAFDFKKIPVHDQEYIRTMFYETVLDRSCKGTGITFNEFYPGASNFTVFSSESDMYNTMNEFANPFKSTASHRLNGRKYFLAWTYDYNQANAVNRIKELY